MNPVSARGRALIFASFLTTIAGLAACQTMGLDPSGIAGLDASVPEAGLFGATVEGGASAPSPGSLDGGSASDAALDGDSATLPGDSATIAFDPPAGNYTTAQAVVLTPSVAGATIYYTTNGSNPTRDSIVFSAPIAVAQNAMIRAMAVVPGQEPSPVVVGTYTLTVPVGTTAPVHFDPPAGSHVNDVSVHLSSTTDGATICYTTNSSLPICHAGTCGPSSSTYVGGVAVATTGTTVRAVACKSGNADSDVTSSRYTFHAAHAVTDVAQGTVPYQQPVVFASTTWNSTIHYTTGAAAPEPTCESPAFPSMPYQASIDQNVVYKTIVCKPGYAPSTIDTFAYRVALGAPTLDTGTYANDHAVVASPDADSATADATYHCFSTGTSPVACDANGGCSAGTTSLTVTASGTTVNAVGCRAGFDPTEPVSGTYDLHVAPVAIAGPTPPQGYDPLTASNYWDGSSPDAFTLGTATTGETIRYSLDGSDVTCQQPCLNDASCRLCSAPDTSCVTPTLSFPPATTIKAIACKTGYAASPTHTLTYANPIGQVTLATPSPGTDTYYDDQTITLSPTPADAKVCYTLGTNPADPTCDVVTEACGGTLVHVYNPNAKPIVSTTGSVLKAIACKSGAAASSLVTATYTLQAVAPTFTPNTGTVDFGTSIAWSSPTTGVSYARTQGLPVAADPACANASGATSVLFNNASGAPASQYKLVACRPGYLASAISAQMFVASLQAPTISPGGNPPEGHFTGPVMVGLSTASIGASGARMCFTTDGGTPACSPTVPVACAGTGNVTQYNGPFQVSVDNTTIRAITCANNYPGSTVSTATLNFGP